MKCSFNNKPVQIVPHGSEVYYGNKKIRTKNDPRDLLILGNSIAHVLIKNDNWIDRIGYHFERLFLGKKWTEFTLKTEYNENMQILVSNKELEGKNSISRVFKHVFPEFVSLYNEKFHLHHNEKNPKQDYLTHMVVDKVTNTSIEKGCVHIKKKGDWTATLDYYFNKYINFAKWTEVTMDVEGKGKLNVLLNKVDLYSPRYSDNKPILKIFKDYI